LWLSLRLNYAVVHPLMGWGATIQARVKMQKGAAVQRLQVAKMAQGGPSWQRFFDGFSVLTMGFRWEFGSDFV
jgi:hypothetical protein